MTETRPQNVRLIIIWSSPSIETIELIYSSVSQGRSASGQYTWPYRAVFRRLSSSTQQTAVRTPGAVTPGWPLLQRVIRDSRIFPSCLMKYTHVLSSIEKQMKTLINMSSSLVHVHKYFTNLSQTFLILTTILLIWNYNLAHWSKIIIVHSSGNY